MKYRWLIWTVVVLCSLPLVLAAEGLVLRAPGIFAQISVPVIFLSLSLLIWKNGVIVWYAAALYALLDMYTATPFGVVLYAGTLAMLVTFWLYRAIITNQGIMAAGLVTGVLIIITNVFYALGRLFLQVVAGAPFSGSAWAALFVSQTLITVFAAVVLYALLSMVIPALKVTHARATRIYG